MLWQTTAPFETIWLTPALAVDHSQECTYPQIINLTLYLWKKVNFKGKLLAFLYSEIVSGKICDD